MPAGSKQTSKAIAAAPLHVSGDYIYDLNDSLLRRYPSRFGGTAGNNAFKTSHDEFADAVVALLKTIMAPLDDPGTYAELRPFVNEGSPFYNIIAVVPGTDPVLKNEFVLVGGHYDCTTWTLDGAIDCGMQVALTAAVLKAFVDYWVGNRIRPKRSLMVAFFDGEEQCLCGSVSFTTTDAYRGMNHLASKNFDLPPQASVVAYHDTDMIGANYPGRYFGRSDLDFMPLNVSSAPTYTDGEGPDDRLARAWEPYAATAPAHAAKFMLYRQDMKAARDRLFVDMRTKFAHTSFTYRDGQTRPLFTESQKKYVNIQDDPADRSDHSVLILQGIPAEISIGIWDPNSSNPGLLSYHNANETLEFLNYMYSGQQRRSAETILGVETAGMFVAYTMGANKPEEGLFLLGETGAP
ncbi:MAG: M28 family peptidase [Actinomycetota bacterium]